MTYTSALAALADPTRRAVFEALRAGPRTVGAIAAGVPVSRPAVSQHLKALKQAGLVKDRPEGTRRVYYIDPEGLVPLRLWLHEILAPGARVVQSGSGKHRWPRTEEKALNRTRQRAPAGSGRGALPPPGMRHSTRLRIVADGRQD